MCLTVYLYAVMSLAVFPDCFHHSCIFLYPSFCSCRIPAAKHHPAYPGTRGIHTDIQFPLTSGWSCPGFRKHETEQTAGIIPYSVGTGSPGKQPSGSARVRRQAFLRYPKSFMCILLFSCLFSAIILLSYIPHCTLCISPPVSQYKNNGHAVQPRHLLEGRRIHG